MLVTMMVSFGMQVLALKQGIKRELPHYNMTCVSPTNADANMRQRTSL